MTTKILPVLHIIRPGQYAGIHFKDSGGDDGGSDDNKSGDDDSDDDGEAEEEDEADKSDKKNDKKAKSDEKGISITSKGLKERINRARGSEREAIFKALGVKDMEELNVKLDKAKEAENKDKSEAELSKQAAENEKKRADAAEKTAADLAEKVFNNTLEKFALKASVDEEEFEDLVLPKMRKYIKDNDLDPEDISSSDFKEFFTNLKKKHPGAFIAKDVSNDTGPKDKKKDDKQAQSHSKPPKPISEMTREEKSAYYKSRGWPH